MSQLQQPSAQRFHVALAKHLDLDPMQIIEPGFTVETGYTETPDTVRVTWEGVTYMTLTELNRILLEAQTV